MSSSGFLRTREERARTWASLRSAAHPPLGDARFWAVQAMVVLITGFHLFSDLHPALEENAFPGGLPVALLIIPIGYAALHYGLSGSAATGAWAALLWIPDLILPHDQGHAGADLINLALVEAIAFFVGQRIEAERLARSQVEQATWDARAAEARYRQLFETNGAPIAVLDTDGRVVDSNPAARTLFAGDPTGQLLADLLGPAWREVQAGQACSLPNARDYRVRLEPLVERQGDAFAQAIFEDVTAERSDSRRATRYANLVVRAEEEQRARLARELHDEPLQLFLHLARSLERLSETPAIPESVAEGLVRARLQALEAAGRLRSLARDLRPPALDQLGFVPALSSLLADVEEESPALIDLAVEGQETRLDPEIELGAFRIAEEAVRNALRHAAPTHIKVNVTLGPDALSLKVADDGRGFVPEEAAGREEGHLGLLGMRERTRLLGGDLKVISAPGRGTLVEAKIPLEHQRLTSDHRR
jgi:signal transduction histidine kinase